MQESCKLLANEGLNVSETAYALGFSNVQNFIRAFSSVMGVTPKAFKSRT
jgi:AraC-like DNA-binding protein